MGGGCYLWLGPPVGACKGKDPRRLLQLQPELAAHSKWLSAFVPLLSPLNCSYVWITYQSGLSCALGGNLCLFLVFREQSPGTSALDSSKQPTKRATNFQTRVRSGNPRSSTIRRERPLLINLGCDCIKTKEERPRKQKHRQGVEPWNINRRYVRGQVKHTILKKGSSETTENSWKESRKKQWGKVPQQNNRRATTVNMKVKATHEALTSCQQGITHEIWHGSGLRASLKYHCFHSRSQKAELPPQTPRV